MTTTPIQASIKEALCARIQAAAIKCDTYHVFVEYSPHVASLSVRMRPKDHDYMAKAETWPVPLIDEIVYLESKYVDPVAELTWVIEKLQALGVEV